MTNADGNGSGTPAGWYPDTQTGGQRYWDGSQWTEHRAPAAGAAPQQNRYPTMAGAAQNTKPWYLQTKWIVGGVVALLFIIGAASGSGSSDDRTQKASDTSSASTSEEPQAAEAKAEKPGSKKSEGATEEAPEQASEPAAMSVTAQQLLKDYEDNELAADQKYKDKSLRVSGVVDKIDTDFFNEDEYILYIRPGQAWALITVNCHDMSTDVLANLKEGQPVTVVGDFDDGGDLGVEMYNCSMA